MKYTVYMILRDNWSAFLLMFEAKSCLQFHYCNYALIHYLTNYTIKTTTLLFTRKCYKACLPYVSLGYSFSKLETLTFCILINYLQVQYDVSFKWEILGVGVKESFHISGFTRDALQCGRGKYPDCLYGSYCFHVFGYLPGNNITVVAARSCSKFVIIC